MKTRFSASFGRYVIMYLSVLCSFVLFSICQADFKPVKYADCGKPQESSFVLSFVRPSIHLLACLFFCSFACLLVRSLGR